MINRLGYSFLLSECNVDEIKKNLTVCPVALQGYEATPFEIYRISKTRIYMPKFYGIATYGQCPIKPYTLNQISPIFNGNLLDHQVDICNSLLDEIKTNKSCIANMATGQGKTICALWLLTQLKVRTLIIVHKEFLADQWEKKIKQFITGVSVGYVKQDTCELDRDIVICMVQTLISRKYTNDKFKSFNFTIYDEVHHFAANTFSSAIYTCGSEYSLGLSATPTRKDGLTKILEWSLGKIITNVMNSDIENPTVVFIEAEYEKEIVPKYNFKGQLNNADLINKLVLDERRNNIIINSFKNLKDRKILVLSDRRGHCIKLCEMTKEFEKNVGIYLGGMDIEELEKSNKARIIFATYQSVCEGYDNPELDTLVMATGRGDVVQSVGRILRRRNKLNPLIIDITDKDFFMGQYRKRFSFYKSKECVKEQEVRKYKFIDDD